MRWWRFDPATGPPGLSPVSPIHSTIGFTGGRTDPSYRVTSLLATRNLHAAAHQATFPVVPTTCCGCAALAPSSNNEPGAAWWCDTGRRYPVAGRFDRCGCRGPAVPGARSTDPPFGTPSTSAWQRCAQRTASAPKRSRCPAPPSCAPPVVPIRWWQRSWPHEGLRGSLLRRPRRRSAGRRRAPRRPCRHRARCGQRPCGSHPGGDSKVDQFSDQPRLPLVSVTSHPSSPTSRWPAWQVIRSASSFANWCNAIPLASCR